MSWHFSQALEAEFLAASSLDGERFARWKSTPTAQDDSCNAKMRGTFHRSQFGMMYAPSTDALGAELLTWFLEDFRVSHFRVRAEDGELPSTYGQRCCELSEKLSLDTCSPRTSRKKRSQSRRETSSWPGSIVELGEFPPPHWLAAHTDESASGWLPTPTATANHECESMQKWPNHRLLRRVTCGRSIGPSYWEWMMGWPIGWTDSEPLGTDRFRKWLLSHGKR